MMDHYSHVRMAAKREAVDAIASGLMETIPRSAKSAENGTGKSVTSQSTSQRGVGRASDVRK